MNIYNIYMGNIYVIVNKLKNEVIYSRTTLLFNIDDNKYIDLLANKKIKDVYFVDNGDEYIKFSDGFVPFYKIINYISDEKLKNKIMKVQKISKRKLLKIYKQFMEESKKGKNQVKVLEKR